MIPVICFVGAKNAGKTTILENIIPVLSDRGYRVGTVKHDVHGFEMDKEGKDTWRHSRAGAGCVCISSPDKVAVIRSVDTEMDLAEIVTRYFWREDIILAEGFKGSHFPKVEVFRKEIEDSPVCSNPERDNLIAIFGDIPEGINVRHFGWKDIHPLVDFIEERYLKSRKAKAVSVLVDGKSLPMNDFVERIVGETIEGLLKSLRGWKNPDQVVISIKRGGK